MIFDDADLGCGSGCDSDYASDYAGANGVAATDDGEGSDAVASVCVVRIRECEYNGNYLPNGLLGGESRRE